MKASDYRKHCRQIGGGKTISRTAHAILLESDDTKAAEMMEKQFKEWKAREDAKEQEVLELISGMEGWELIESTHCK